MDVMRIDWEYGRWIEWFSILIASIFINYLHTLIFWASAIRNQWLWALLSHSILWGKRRRLKQCLSLQNSLAHWSLDAAWMAEVGKTLVRIAVIGKNREVKKCRGLEKGSISGIVRMNLWTIKGRIERHE